MAVSVCNLVVVIKSVPDVDFVRVEVDRAVCDNDLEICFEVLRVRLCVREIVCVVLRFEAVALLDLVKLVYDGVLERREIDFVAVRVRVRVTVRLRCLEGDTVKVIDVVSVGVLGGWYFDAEDVFDVVTLGFHERVCFKVRVLRVSVPVLRRRLEVVTVALRVLVSFLCSKTNHVIAVHSRSCEDPKATQELPANVQLEFQHCDSVKADAAQGASESYDPRE